MEKTKKRINKKTTLISVLIAIVLVFSLLTMRAAAANILLRGMLIFYGNTFVAWHPMDSYQAQPNGTIAYTGQGALDPYRSAQTGMHAYTFDRGGGLGSSSDIIYEMKSHQPISYWKAISSDVKAVHGGSWHGGVTIGGNYYYWDGQGGDNKDNTYWHWWCADCGNGDFGFNYYMWKSVAEKLKVMGNNYNVYIGDWKYGGLEMGASFGTTIKKHMCTQYSYNVYYIKYDNNGGSGSIENTTHLYNNGRTSYNGVTKDYQYEGKKLSSATNKITSSKPTRAGYRFIGWEYDGKTYTSGQEISNLTTSNGETLTFKAKWQPIEISYNSNGTSVTAKNTYNDSFTTNPSGTEDDTTFVPGIDTDKVTLSSGSKFSRVGYTLSHWNTKGDNSGTKFNLSQQTTANQIPLTGGYRILYAIWNPITYKVSYTKGLTNDANASHSIAQDTIRFDQNYTTKANVWTGRTYTLAFDANLPKRSDRTTTKNTTTVHATFNGSLTFNKWSIAGNYKSGTYNASTAVTQPNWCSTQNGTATATATWNNTVLNNFGTPYLKGYTFKGYWFNTNGTGTAGVEGDFSTATETGITSITINPNTSAFNKTLYAWWSANNSTIKYNGNNTTNNIYGDKVTTNFTGSTSDTTLTYDSSGTLATNKFNKVGYEFKCWSTSSNGNDANALTFTDGQALDVDTVNKLLEFKGVQDSGASITLYAIWEPINYTVTFDGNDNWNNQAAYTQVFRFDQTLPLTANKFNRIAPYTKDNVLLTDSYNFIGWTYTKNQSTVEFTDKQSVKNISTRNGVVLKEITLYAIWQKDLKLTISLNNGKFNGVGDDIVLTHTIYNNVYYWDFPIAEYFGSYDSDTGMNTNLRKADESCGDYRFIGYSLVKISIVPDETPQNMDVYSQSRISKYRAYNNTTLYAIWEKPLQSATTAFRTAGTVGEHDITNAEVTSRDRGIKELYVTAKAGEHITYGIYILADKDITTSISFDDKINRIYSNPGPWTDNLNDSNLTSNSLNKEIVQSSQSVYQGGFYLPRYLGTNESEPASRGVKEYKVYFKNQQDSYFMTKYKGKKEEAIVILTIKLVNDTDIPGVDPIPDDPQAKIEDLKTVIK